MVGVGVAVVEIPLQIAFEGCEYVVKVCSVGGEAVVLPGGPGE